jgi:predicted nucleic acid-binding protein
MKLLLDTDTSVFWLRGHSPVRERMTQVDPQTITISVITLAELRYGQPIQPDQPTTIKPLMISSDEPAVETAG